MRVAIYLHTLRRTYKTPLYVGLGLGMVSLLFSGLFADFKDQLGQFTDMIPAGMEAVLGDMANATSPEGWLGLELFPLFVLVSMAILGVVLAASVIGSEEDDGTLELVLASSNSRFRIVCEKFVALVSALAIPPLILFMFIVLGTVLFDFPVDTVHVLAACVSAWGFGAAFGGIGFAVQAMTGRRGLATASGIAVFGVMYGLHIVSKLVESWKDTDVYSLVHYYNIPSTLMDGMDWAKFAVLAVVAGACFVVALLGFARRDTGV